MEAIRIGLSLLFFIMIAALFFGLIRAFVARYLDDFYQKAFEKMRHGFKRTPFND